MANRVHDIRFIWLHPPLKIKKLGSATFRSAWITFTCTRCCRRASAGHPEVKDQYSHACLINVWCSLHLPSFPKASLFTGHQALRADPHLFKDDVNIPAKLEAADSHANKLFSCSQVDIRFSRTLNSCKLPQIRYATPERLLQRLTDLRFLSIDFLNTFLLTYRVFTGEDLSRKSILMVTCGLRAKVHSFASFYSSFFEFTHKEQFTDFTAPSAIRIYRF